MPESPIAVVTGGNKGIGLEICRQLAAGADLKDLVVPISDGDLRLAMREGILFNKQMMAVISF